MERKKLKFEPVVLTPEQMRYAESAMPAICARGGWEFKTGAGGPDHVHVVLGGDHCRSRKGRSRGVSPESGAAPNQI
jgi:hypothetical protein